MQFVKNIVDSIGCVVGDTNVDAIIDNMDQYHARVWKQFSLMPIEKLPKRKEQSSNESRQFGSVYSSPKSLLLPSISPKQNRSPLSSNSGRKEFHVALKEVVAQPNSHQENVFLALYDAKSKLYQLEQCLLSPAYPTERKSKHKNLESSPLNLDKISQTLEKTEKIMAELKAEILNSQASVLTTKDNLDSIFKTLQTPSSSIESATDALKMLSEHLTDRLYQFINLVDADELFLTLAKQLRIFWLVHFPNHQKGPYSTFESQLNDYVEVLFNVLIETCQINSKTDFSPLTSNVSLEVFLTLFESILPYSAVVGGQSEFSVNSVMRIRYLISILETGLVSQYSLISSNINGFPQVRVIMALLRLLHKYSLKAINKPATDLPPFDYPAIYANVLGKMLNSAKSLLLSKTFLNHTAIFLLEIYEIFEVYSGFKIHDDPFGLDCLKKFLDSLLNSLGDSIWNYMGPMEHKLHSQNIEPNSIELWKYISKKYPQMEEEAENDEPSAMEIMEIPMASSSTLVTPMPPLPSPAESPLTTRIERVYSPTIDVDKEEDGKVPDEGSVSKPKQPSSSETVGESPSPNKKHKSDGNSESNAELKKPLVIDLDAEPSTSPQLTSPQLTSPQLTSPPTLASSAAEAVRQSSKSASASSKSSAPSESDQLKMQVLHLQGELSQMGKRFDRLMEKLTHRPN
ncbi:hypothetical protein TYRP_019005 [Tyrophagus putrescentiae]|nr:hypothetical protein TYRP_019005 [Tyrophagus putrescentiae]